MRNGPVVEYNIHSCMLGLQWRASTCPGSRYSVHVVNAAITSWMQELRGVVDHLGVDVSVGAAVGIIVKEKAIKSSLQQKSVL